MNQYSQFVRPKAGIIRPEMMNDSAEWRLLRRLHLPDGFNDEDGGAVKHALVVDVESTGLPTEADDVTPLALLPFEYKTESVRILAVGDGRRSKEFRSLPSLFPWKIPW